MKKIIIVVLILIASGTVYSGEKEYTYKSCHEGKTNCNECKIEEGKISYKVSKSLRSVMKTYIKKDGTIDWSGTIDNCKIFDEDTFECETIFETGGTGSSIREVLSNGKWEWMTRYGAHMSEGKMVKESVSYTCGTEIKNIFNFFK